jgi:hypothetical protein
MLDFKKNPMLVKLKAKTCGITLRTSPLSDLTMLELMLATFLPIWKSFLLGKKDVKKGSSGVGRDQIEVSLEVRTTSLDVNPCLTKEIYDRTQLDEFETVELTQSDMRGMGMALGLAEEDSKIYRQHTRGMITVADLKLSLEVRNQVDRTSTNFTMKA